MTAAIPAICGSAATMADRSSRSSRSTKRRSTRAKDRMAGLRAGHARLRVMSVVREVSDVVDEFGLLLAMAAALALAASAHAQTFKQVASIEIPGTPIKNYGVLTIDQATGLGYLADKDNKAVVVFDTKTDKFVTRIAGFVGMTGSGNASGPNGVVIVSGGAELWVSDGDSTIKVVDLKTNTITATIATGGKLRANAMAFDPSREGGDRRQFQRRSAVLQPDLGRARPQDSGKAAGAAVGREPGALRLARAERHVLHGDPGLQRRQEQRPPGADRSEERDHRQAARARALPPAQPVDRLRHDDLPRLQHGARSQPQARRRHGGVRYRERQDRELRRGLGRQWRLDRQSRARRNTITPPPTARWWWSTPRRGSSSEGADRNGARSLGVNLATSKIYVATTAKGGPCGGCIVAFAQE